MTSPVTCDVVATKGLLTLSQFAAACVPRDAVGGFDEDRLRLWTRRLRHWSRLGILPLTRYRDASGSHRLYRREDVYLAAILLRLAGPGLPHNVINLISDEIQRSIRPGGSLFDFWADAQAHAKSDADDREHQLIVWIAAEGSEVFIGGAIFLVAENVLRSSQDLGLADEPAILVSLTNVFRDLGLAA